MMHHCELKKKESFCIYYTQLLPVDPEQVRKYAGPARVKHGVLCFPYTCVLGWQLQCIFCLATL
jgi:hypothetical protein